MAVCGAIRKLFEALELLLSFPQTNSLSIVAGRMLIAVGGRGWDLLALETLPLDSFA